MGGSGSSSQLTLYYVCRRVRDQMAGMFSRGVCSFDIANDCRFLELRMQFLPRQAKDSNTATLGNALLLFGLAWTGDSWLPPLRPAGAGVRPRQIIIVIVQLLAPPHLDSLRFGSVSSVQGGAVGRRRPPIARPREGARGLSGPSCPAW